VAYAGTTTYLFSFLYTQILVSSSECVLDGEAKDRKVLGSVSWTLMSCFGGRAGERVMMKTIFIGAFDGWCRW
jgi:hypothetical protein